jgi:hypothetical protein
MEQYKSFSIFLASIVKYIGMSINLMKTSNFESSFGIIIIILCVRLA